MRRISRRATLLAAALAAVLGALLLVGLTRGASSPAGPHPARTAAATLPAPPAGARWFRLADADRRIAPNDRDFAVRTRATGPLLLFLPATGQHPADYTRLLTIASQQGYHVLGLDYFNVGRSVAATCGHDAGCYGALERNRFDGGRPFAGSRVDPANSILSRLRMALDHLRSTDPGGGWGAYLHGDAVQWPDVVLAGHSQGGGIAAWIAHTRAVRGLLMFGSPIVTDGDVSATWLSTRSATPTSRMVAFDDTHDVFFSRIEASWRLLGLGPQSDVTGGRTPSGRALVTTLVSPQPHLGMAADVTPSTPSGEPVYAPVWTWMLRRFI